MEVKEVNHKAKLVTIDGDGWTVTIVKGKVRAQMGFLTPVEQKKVHRMYHAIIDSATNHTAPKGTLD